MFTLSPIRVVPQVPVLMLLAAGMSFSLQDILKEVHSALIPVTPGVPLKQCVGMNGGAVCYFAVSGGVHFPIWFSRAILSFLCAVRGTRAQPLPRGRGEG